jgi:hypothetical protein
MHFIPREADNRSQELSHTAWRLYCCYCFHRNWETGRCDPSNARIHTKTRIEETYVSVAKRELIEKGWVERAGKRAVRLIVGELEFEKRRTAILKAREEREKRKGKRRTKQTGANWDNHNIQAEADAVLDGAEQTGAQTSSPRVWEQEPVDEAFILTIINAGTYPDVDVRFVYNKLSLRAHFEGVAVNKSRLLHWLSQESIRQPNLPTIGASVLSMPTGAERNASPASAATQAATKHPANCVCFGSGMESTPKGSRRCTALDADRPASAATDTEAKTLAS